MISIIKTMKPAGSYDSQHGTFFKFHLQFEDGSSGECSAKSESPWYSEGSEVDYQITGDFKGQNRLKVGKAEFAGKSFGGGGGSQSYKGTSNTNPPQQSSQRPSSPSPAPSNGARCGMIVNNAVLLLNDSKEAKTLENAVKFCNLVLAMTEHTENPKSQPSPSDIGGSHTPAEPEQDLPF